MATNYPSSIQTFTDPSGTSPLATGPDHAALHTTHNDTSEAVQAKIGVGSGTPVADRALIGSGNGTSAWTTTWNNAIMGTPRITGGTVTSLIGTAQITGGTVTTALLSGGTLANAAIGTPTIIGGTIAVNGTVIPLSIGAALVPTTGTIVDVAGGTYTVNAQSAQIFYSVMGTAAGNRTIGTPTNLTAGQSLTYAFKASGSANGTLVWPTGIHRYSQDVGTPTLGTGTTWNYFSWRYNGIDSKLDFMGQSANVI